MFWNADLYVIVNIMKDIAIKQDMGTLHLA